jgi:hypothetical protein
MRKARCCWCRSPQLAAPPLAFRFFAVSPIAVEKFDGRGLTRLSGRDARVSNFIQFSECRPINDFRIIARGPSKADELADQ